MCVWGLPLLFRDVRKDPTLMESVCVWGGLPLLFRDVKKDPTLMVCYLKPQTKEA